MPDISALIQQFPYIGLFSLLILGGIGFPFPEDTTLILCGFLISTNVVKPVNALLVVVAGVLLTDSGLYAVGRKYGRKIFTHRRFSKILTAERLSKLEEKFDKLGVLFILIGRHVAGLRAQIFLAAGITRMPVAKFLIADAVALILTIALLVGLGIAGGHSLQLGVRNVNRFEHIGILLGILLLVTYLSIKYFKSGRD